MSIGKHVSQSGASPVPELPMDCKPRPLDQTRIVHRLYVRAACPERVAGASIRYLGATRFQSFRLLYSTYLEYKWTKRHIIYKGLSTRYQAAIGRCFTTM